MSNISSNIGLGGGGGASTIDSLAKLPSGPSEDDVVLLDVGGTGDPIPLLYDGATDVWRVRQRLSGWQYLWNGSKGVFKNTRDIVSGTWSEDGDKITVSTTADGANTTQRAALTIPDVRVPLNCEVRYQWDMAAHSGGSSGFYWLFLRLAGPGEGSSPYAGSRLDHDSSDSSPSLGTFKVVDSDGNTDVARSPGKGLSTDTKYYYRVGASYRLHKSGIRTFAKVQKVSDGTEVYDSGATNADPFGTDRVPFFYVADGDDADHTAYFHSLSIRTQKSQ